MARNAISDFRGNIGTSSFNVDGTGNGYVLIANNSNLSLTTSFTILVWVYVTAFGASGWEVLEKGNIGSATTGSYKIFFGSTGQLRFTDVNVVDINDSGSLRVKLNTWNAIAVTHTGTTYTFYVRGTKSGAVTNANNCTSNSATLIVGRRANTASNAFTGNIGGVGIWQTNLSDAQIAALSSIGPNIPTSNLSMYIPFTEAAGTTFHDMSSNSNTGTLTGTGFSISTSNTPFPARGVAVMRSTSATRSLV